MDYKNRIENNMSSETIDAYMRHYYLGYKIRGISGSVYIVMIICIIVVGCIYLKRNRREF